MEGITHLQRTVDDIVGEYRDLDIPEERRGQKVEGSLFFEGLDELLKQYEKVFRKKGTKHCDKKYAQLGKMGLPALLPEHINAFLQATIGYESHDTYGWDTGLFLTRLVQNSYDTGNNKFRICTRGLALLGHLGRHLEGRKRRPIEVIIDGDVGEECGRRAKYSSFSISGNIGRFCGSGAEKSTFSISGHVGSWCGEN
ncbi:MAG: hypothetical protein QME12_09055, partial [Nanoarchaeota archaeon]|nr:hypothetical protein [Nanoarchaeota archaeon]